MSVIGWIVDAIAPRSKPDAIALGAEIVTPTLERARLGAGRGRAARALSAAAGFARAVGAIARAYDRSGSSARGGRP